MRPPSILQQFKAACQVGVTCMFTAHWCPTPTLRTVTKVQSARVAFTHPTKPSESWLDFPKATHITSPEPGLFVIDIGFAHPDAHLTYDFRK